MNVNDSNDIESDTSSGLRRYFKNAIISMAFINVGKWHIVFGIK